MANWKPTRGSTFLNAGKQRIRDAKTLLEGHRYHGSIYMAGYAVECSLKDAICRRRGEIHLDKKDEEHSDTHESVERLLERAFLKRARDEHPTARRDFELLLQHWKVEMRYAPDAGTRQAAETVLRVAKRLMDFLWSAPGGA